MRKVAIYLISFYQKHFSLFIVTNFGHSCKYEITCSQFAKEAIQNYGIVKGGKMAATRILSCK